MSINEAVDLYIKAGLDVMTAIKKVAKDRKIPKNEVYKEYHKEENNEVSSGTWKSWKGI